MRHTIDSKIHAVEVSTLRDCPRSAELHSNFEPLGKDAWLIDDIRTYGILLPLLVRPDGTVADGHRRLCAARLLNLGAVPAIVLTSADDEAAFNSAQLARKVSLYAKCVLYRGRLTELMNRGSDASSCNLRQNRRNVATIAPDGTADNSALDRDWSNIVEVLGYTRRSLLCGVKLLDALDRMRATAEPDQLDRANRVLSVFRNRGLSPALRMIGEADEPNDGEEPDCREWGCADDGSQDSVMRKRGAKKYARKLPEVANEPQTAKLAKGGCNRSELHAQLDAALEWAARHGVQLSSVGDDGAEGIGVEVGRSHCGDIHRLSIDYVTDAKAFERPAHHRKLLQAALALFLFSHPVTKRQVEAMPLVSP